MRFFDMFKNVLFTKRCRFCGNVIDIRLELCDFCKNNLQRVSGEICLKCGCDKLRCKCSGENRFYKSVVAPFYYEGAIHRTVWLLKFRQRKEFADVIAEEMATCFFKHYSEYKIDYCTFVPVHRSTLKKRGYNHAELIADSFAAAVGFESTALLDKIYKTESQHTLSSVLRTGNLSGAFEVKKEFDVTDKRILLVDDVKTTGATLNECAKTLIANGAAEVICIVGAVVGGEQKNALQ